MPSDLATASPLLAVTDLRKSYGDHVALDGVTLDVRPGELVVLLGPNGAGKSTLLQLITGLFVADSGSIAVCGHDVRTHMIPALALLGVVFQQPTLDPELSVDANLRFHADLQGLPKKAARERIDAALARFDLTARRRDLVRTLSGGNRRRVELARSLLHAPRLLVMDEATVGLDPASRRDLMSYVHDLSNTGIGILWTTHLIDEAALADRIYVLEKGCIAFAGTPSELSASVDPPDLGRAFLELTGANAAPMLTV